MARRLERALGVAPAILAAFFGLSSWGISPCLRVTLIPTVEVWAPPYVVTTFAASRGTELLEVIVARDIDGARYGTTYFKASRQMHRLPDIENWLQPGADLPPSPQTGTVECAEEGEE
jgi:hypothetical protein